MRKVDDPLPNIVYTDAYLHCVAAWTTHLATLLDYVVLSGPFFFCLVCGPREITHYVEKKLHTKGFRK